MRVGHLYLQCIDDAENRIVTVPAAFTDYNDSTSDANASDRKEYFTIKALIEADEILINAAKLSTE